MRVAIVPNELRDELYKRIDAQLEKHPVLKNQRELIYEDMLSYFDHHGVIPDFTIEPKEIINETT